MPTVPAGAARSLSGSVHRRPACGPELHRRAQRCDGFRDATHRNGNSGGREPARGLFSLIFEVVESLKGKFQVIITDHPDFSDNARFQKALRERWRDGLKLVPEDWPPAP
ncbi:DUF3732 domain-containing protein [Cupriavidus gilardii]|uniref:DUF3732 domain-containing protein n=1 Tax=Cupriavidus gilardii TaxID=82541 RepID=UPI001C2D6A44